MKFFLSVILISSCLFMNSAYLYDAQDILAKHCIDILSPTLNDNSNCLSNVNSFGSLTYNKVKTSIETKVTAINCGVLTFNLTIKIPPASSGQPLLEVLKK